MRKTNEGRSPAGILLPAAAAGLIATILLLLIWAVLVQRGTLDENLVRPFAVAGLSLGCALAAFIAAKRAPGGRFIWAAAAGMTVFLLLFAGGMLIVRKPVHILKTAVSFLCAFVASALGGFAGATSRGRRKYSHIKK